MADFSLVAKLMADASGFKSGISDAIQSLGELPKATEEIIKGVGDSMTSLGNMMTTTITAPAVAGVTAVIKSYADLEQAVGGIETMFKGSAGEVIKNSESAYTRAGVSGVEYMEQVTSFSATLLQGLGGDTVQAAAYADKAIVDMSDNANKFGTNITDIQNAYQGFAKGNFTMLDNLKLGYGGTQAEMARLVNESGVLNGEFEATAENVKDIPFDVLIEAIHQTQKEMGVTGTTAKEASETVSGAFGSMVAAAKNLVAGLGDENADIETLMKNLQDTVIIFVDNIKRVLGNIWDNLPLAEWQKWAGLIVIAAGPILTVFGTLLKGIGSISGALGAVGSALKIAISPAGLLAGAIIGVIAAFVYLMATSEDFRTTVINALTEVKDRAIQIFNDVKKYLTEMIDAFKQTDAIESIRNAFDKISTAVMHVIDSIKSMFGTFNVAGVEASTLGGVFGDLVSKVADFAGKIADFISGLDPSTIQNVTKAVLGVVGAFQLLKVGSKIKDIFSNLFGKKNPVTEFAKGASKGGETISKVFAGISKVVDSSFKGISGVIKSLGTAISTVFKSLGTGISTAAKGIGTGISTILKGIGTMTRTMNPVNMIVFAGAIAIVIAALALLATQSEGVAEILEGFGEAIGTILKAIGTAVSELVMAIGTALGSIITAIGGSISQIITAMTPVIEILAGTISDIVTTVVENIPAIIEAFGGLIESISNGIATIAEAIAPIISTISETLIEIVSIVTTNIPPIIDSFSELVTSISEGVATIIEAVAPIVETLSSTFETVVQTIADAVVQITEAIAPFIPSFTEMVTEITANIPVIIDAFSQLASALGESVSQIIGSISELVTEISAGISNIIREASTLASEIGGAMSGVIESIGTAVSDVITAFQPIVDEIPGIISEASGLIETGFEGIQGTIEAVGEAISGVIDSISGFVDSIGETATNVGTSIQTIADAAVTLSEADVGGLAGNMSSLAGGLVAISLVNTSAIGEGLQSIANAVTGMTAVSGMDVGVTNLGNSLTGLGTKSSESQPIIETALTAISTAFSTFTTAITTSAAGISAVMISITNAITKAMDSSRTAVTNATNTIKTTFTETFSSIETATTSSMSNIASSVADGMNDVAQSGREGGDGFHDGLKAGLNDAISTARSSISSVISELGSGVDRARSAGANLGRGFQSGLASMRNSIVNTAIGIANAASAAIESALDIHSPSRVGEGLGSFFGEGIDLGMHDWISKVYKTATQMAEGMKSGIENIKTAEMGVRLSVQEDLRGLNYKGMVDGLLNNTVNFVNNGTKKPQPAYITLRIGNSDFEYFVEDITTAQQRQDAILSRQI